MIYVSAVMPTTAVRLPFVRKSIKYFLAQTYKDVELVIRSQDYSQELRDAIPNDENVRYTYGFDGLVGTTGDLRNAANRAAFGNIIIHWDDDDWYAPERIADEVGFLISSGKQVIGYHDMIYYRPDDQKFFKYRYQQSKDMPHYAVGTSQCYWTEYWKQNPFRPIRIGEDSAFSIVASSKKEIISKDSNGMLVALAHEGSTSKPALGNSQFPKIPATQAPAAFLKEVGLA